MTSVYEIDPLQDIRWPRFLEKHNLAGLFHSREWLEALRLTYGFRATVLTTAGPGADLTNGLVFCRVQSSLTGSRLVSVPFSDHCTPLTDSREELGCLLGRLQAEADKKSRRHLEIRAIDGVSGVTGDLPTSDTFCLHQLDLHPTLDKLFSAFHGDCVRRKIKRAERDGVTYEDGTSEEILSKFYRLVVRTRRRHLLPPQPLSWFRNLIACTGDRLKIRLTSYQGQPTAAILTIRYKDTMTYKYGCSDPGRHNLGSIQLLLWKAIQEAKQDGLVQFDLGRTEWSNEGLLAFKDRWGGKRSTLRYLRHPALALSPRPRVIAKRIANKVFALLPDWVLKMAGNILYRHFA
jgi:hypothetical protein